MRKVRLRNIRKKAIVIVLDPAYYKTGVCYTDAVHGGSVPESITVFGGSESKVLDASVARIPQVRSLKNSGVLRIIAAKPAAKPSGKAAGKKSAPKAKGSGSRRKSRAKGTKK